MIIIDGVTWNVPVVGLRRTGDFLDRYATRTTDGELKRKLIGVYFNYEITFGRMPRAVHSALWEKLTEPVEFHTVTVPYNDTTYTFTAYFSNVGDELMRQTSAANYWGNLTVNFTAKSPARS